MRIDDVAGHRPGRYCSLRHRNSNQLNNCGFRTYVEDVASSIYQALFHPS